jgi:hypothetical protein
MSTSTEAQSPPTQQINSTILRLPRILRTPIRIILQGEIEADGFEEVVFKLFISYSVGRGEGGWLEG